LSSPQAKKSQSTSAVVNNNNINNVIPSGRRSVRGSSSQSQLASQQKNNLYDPLEDLRLHFKASSEQVQMSIGMGMNGDGDDNDNDDDFDDLEEPTYLQKELEYKKMNEELEKRSRELFQKIDAYSSVIINNCNEIRWIVIVNCNKSLMNYRGESKVISLCWKMGEEIAQKICQRLVIIIKLSLLLLQLQL
jgi:hypothetical protein